ncbi:MULTISPECIES: histidine phosphatase family protein [Prochlorococcus]|uniref:Phosphoglycerate mutase n=1 Tax=Prochlorococcus marinus (strain SARG / CCMP1375 / SS120) TaxID=167539 RepID=Q7VD68_PROMA|nr:MULTISPECIES: histidine phosphatase family protein [Prochlorococcus]AAP99560.1 Phosphoglycerate mutase [Prochlorococcus marinus subsp. marinus str. CCMP1375]
MTLRLLLIRHGLSSYNLEHRIQGRNDLSTLTTKGTLQASKAGESLRSLHIHAVYTSPLQRAADTAKELIKNRNGELIPILDNDLLEVDLEPWSGLTIDEVKNKFSDLYSTWKHHPKELILHRKNGNSYKPIKELMDQAERFLKKIISTHHPDKNETVLVVGHNAILRCLILKMFKEPAEGFRRIKLDNSSISVFNINTDIENKAEFQVESLNSTSHLTPQIPPKGSFARIFLVRHGETNWNKEGRFQGQIDIPLNENGQKQALAASNFLKNVKFNQAFSSSMSRPMETAKIILRNHPTIEIKQQDELVEIGHGLWEGKLEAEISSEWGDLLKRWKKSPETVQMPEGETIGDVSSRAMNCFRHIAQRLSPNDTALIVAHDAVNKTILCNLLGLTNADIWKVKQGNGGITIIDLTEEQEPDIITCLNITSHLGDVVDRTAQGAL